MVAFDAHKNAEDAFMLQLGRTLVQWQSVEVQAYQMYFKITKGTDRHLVSVNWHHIQSFDARIALLNHCVHFALAADDQKAWKPLRVRIEAASKSRNYMVHSAYGVSYVDGVGTPSLHQSYLDATAITRNRVDLAKNKLRPEFRYDQGKLEALAAEFTALDTSIRQFYENATLIHRSENG